MAVIHNFLQTHLITEHLGMQNTPWETLWKLYQLFFFSVRMLLSTSYRKAKHYLKAKNIWSTPSFRVDSVGLGYQAVVWNLCACLGLSFLLPRGRRSITCSQDNILIRREREEEHFSQSFCVWLEENHSQKPSLQTFSFISLTNLYTNHYQSDLGS